MKNIFKNLSFTNLKNTLIEVFSRFFISWIISIFITSIFIFLVYNDNYYSNDTITNLFKINISLWITFFLSVWVYLICQNYKLWFLKSNLYQILSLAFWLSFYLYLKQTNFDNVNAIVNIFLSFIWFISILFFWGYLKNIFWKNYVENTYYNYFFKIWLVFFTAWIFWWLLSILGWIWISSIFALFELKNIDEWKIFWYYMSTVWALFTPIYALSKIPKEESKVEVLVQNKFFIFILKYLLIPFIYIYFLILYSYSLKVLLNFWDWPKWIICWLVVSFSILGYIVYILSHNLEENFLIKIYRKYFHFAVIPQIFMLFYAIYLRINQYDLTINRYLVVVFWIWLLVLSIYFIFSKTKKLSFVPVLLTIFVLLISTWPWWVNSLPESRQYNLFIKNLETAKILQNWKIVPPKNVSDIKTDLSIKIYDWIDYLCDFENCRKLKTLFKDEFVKLEADSRKKFEENLIQQEKYQTKDSPKLNRNYPWLQNYEIKSYLEEYLKLQNRYSNFENNYEYFSLNYYNSFYPIDLKWFDKILKIENVDEDSLKKDNNISNEYIYIDEKSQDLVYIKNSNEIDRINIWEYYKKALAIYKLNLDKWNKKEDMIYEIESNKFKYKLYFSNFYFKNPDYKKDENSYRNYSNKEWFALIKQK